MRGIDACSDDGTACVGQFDSGNRKPLCCRCVKCQRHLEYLYRRGDKPRRYQSAQQCDYEALAARVALAESEMRKRGLPSNIAPRKICRECGRSLPISEFHGNAKSHDKHCHVCKKCKKKIKDRYQNKVFRIIL